MGHWHELNVLLRNGSKREGAIWGYLESGCQHSFNLLLHGYDHGQEVSCLTDGTSHNHTVCSAGNRFSGSHNALQFVQGDLHIGTGADARGDSEDFELALSAMASLKMGSIPSTVAKVTLRFLSCLTASFTASPDLQNHGR